MALRIVHLHADADGETHFTDVVLEAASAPGGSVSVLSVPTKKLTHAEYDDGAGGDEVIPGYHATPARHFITPLRGGFEVTTTTGATRRFLPGDWIFFDDIGSRGHLTRRIGSERRVNLIVEVADEWRPPTLDS
jgi:hypothetical protein